MGRGKSCLELVWNFIMQAFARLLTPNWMNIVIKCWEVQTNWQFEIDKQWEAINTYLLVNHWFEQENLQGSVRNREKNFTMVNVTSGSPDIWCNFLPGNSLPPDLLSLNATLTNFNILIEVACVKSPCAVFHFFLGRFIVQCSYQCNASTIIVNCPTRQSLLLFIGSLHWLSRFPYPDNKEI